MVLLLAARLLRANILQPPCGESFIVLHRAQTCITMNCPSKHPIVNSENVWIYLLVLVHYCACRLDYTRSLQIVAS